jgi:hypothetical protein
VQRPRPFALARAPRVELDTVGQIQAFQEGAFETLGGTQQLRERGVREASFLEGTDGEEVDVGAARLESYPIPVGREPCHVRAVEEGPYLGKAPPQRSPWVVRHLPQQIAEPLTGLRPTGGDQIAEERPGLLGSGKRARSLIPKYCQLTEEPYLKVLDLAFRLGSGHGPFWSQPFIIRDKGPSHAEAVGTCPGLPAASQFHWRYARAS